MSNKRRGGARRHGLCPQVVASLRADELETRVQKLKRKWEAKLTEGIDIWNGGRDAQGPVKDLRTCAPSDPEKRIAERITDLFGYGTAGRVQQYVEEVMPAYRWALGDGGEPQPEVAIEFAARRVWYSQRDLIEKTWGQDLSHGMCFRYEEHEYDLEWLTPRVEAPKVIQWAPPRYNGDEESQVQEPLYVWSDPEALRRWEADAAFAASIGHVVDPIIGSREGNRVPDIEVEPSRILGLDMCRAPLAALNLSARMFREQLRSNALIRVAGGATPMSAHAVATWVPNMTVEYESMLAGFAGCRPLRPGTLDGAIVMVPSYAASAYWYGAKAFENVVEDEEGNRRPEVKHFDYETHLKARDRNLPGLCPLGTWLVGGALESMRPGGLLALVTSVEGVSASVIPILDEFPGIERIDGVVDGHVVSPVNRPLVCRYDRVNGQPWTALDTRGPDDMVLTLWRLTDA